LRSRLDAHPPHGERQLLRLEKLLLQPRVQGTGYRLQPRG